MKPLFDAPIRPDDGGYFGHYPGSEFHNPRPNHLHGGIDWNGPRRAPVIAGKTGIVTFVGVSTGLGGNKVIVDHGTRRDGHHHQRVHYHFGEKGV